LEHLGDIAAEAQQHDEAITQYSTALSLNPIIPQDVFMKRSKVYMAKRSWEDAIDDTNQVRHFCLALV
jgi:predicted Zn-dependent protease